MSQFYNNSRNISNRFDIREYLDFNDKGRALCPCCSPNHSKKSRTLSVVLSGNHEGAYKCFRGCDPKDIRQALGEAKSFTLPQTVFQNEQQQKPKKVYTVPASKAYEYHLDLLSNKTASLSALRWLEDRGISIEMVKHYRLGIARAKSSEKMTYSITLPIPNLTGDQYYIKKRVAPWDFEITSKEDYEPWKQWGVPATVFFSYLPEQATETWLCEGEWDAMLLGWLVQRHRKDVAVATFTTGCDNVPNKSELNRLPGQVKIFYDRNDKLNKQGERIGEASAKKVAKALGDRGKIAKVPMPENCTVKGWDITDAINHGYQLENFERAVLEAQPYKPLECNSFLSKSRKLSKLFHEAPDYVDWLVPDLFTPNELFGICAPPREGKSLFTMSLAKAVASGGKFLDRPCRQGEVVYICKEDADVKVKQRLIAQEWELEDMENVLINNDFTIDELPELIEYVKFAHPALIIFDTLSRIQRSNGRENSAEIADILAPLQDLAQKENVCILVVHHTRKGNMNDVDTIDIFDQVRGSGAIRATCRGMAVIAKTKEGYRLAVENGYAATQDLKVHLNSSDLTWRLSGRWTPPNVDLSQKEIILDWFYKHQSGTIQKIHDDTLIPKRSLYQVLTRLANENKLKKIGSQRTTTYLLSVQQVQQTDDLLNCSKTVTEKDRGMSSTTLYRNPPIEKVDQKSNEMLQPDQLFPDQPEKHTSVELGDQTALNSVTIGNSDIPGSSTNSSTVELNEEKTIKAISANLIGADQNSHTTNFFPESRSEEKEKEAEKEALQGVWHKEHGYLRVINQQKSLLTVRRSGERKSFKVYLRGCESRREYKTYCEFDEYINYSLS